MDNFVLKYKTFSVLILAVILLISPGCDKKNGEATSQKDSLAGNAKVDSNYTSLRLVFNKQIQGLKGKNVSDYMSTIKVSGLDSINAYNYFESVTKLYDLDYTILNFTVLRSDARSAEVEVEMEVRKVNGPQFDDHRSTTRHILEKIDGGWRIVESREIKFTPIKPELKK